jgi:hypothetical protein
LVAGLDLTTAHSDLPTSTVVNVTTGSSTSFFRAQLGHRWYLSTASDNGRHLRPIVGLGVVGTMSRFELGDSFDHEWTAGGYGEVGATWFFSSHFSLGAVSMLQATKGRERQTATGLSPDLQPIRTTQTTNVWSVSANLARVLASVYS